MVFVNCSQWIYPTKILQNTISSNFRADSVTKCNTEVAKRSAQQYLCHVETKTLCIMPKFSKIFQKCIFVLCVSFFKICSIKERVIFRNSKMNNFVNPFMFIYWYYKSSIKSFFKKSPLNQRNHFPPIKSY